MKRLCRATEQIPESMHVQLHMTQGTTAAGGRIVTVGTTAVRTLESVAALAAEQRERGAAPADAVVVPYRGRTALFIQPGYRFRAVDVMLTNFHLPRSTP